MKVKIRDHIKLSNTCLEIIADLVPVSMTPRLVSTLRFSLFSRSGLLFNLPVITKRICIWFILLALCASLFLVLPKILPSARSLQFFCGLLRLVILQSFHFICINLHCVVRKLQCFFYRNWSQFLCYFFLYSW